MLLSVRGMKINNKIAKNTDKVNISSIQYYNISLRIIYKKNIGDSAL